MYTLHIANKNYSSWSLRPWILLTELSIPFREVLSPFGGGSNWQTFREFSPTGLVPCLVDGDEAIWDSLAIVEYVAEAHKQVWPDDKAARAWARCASAEMHAGFSALRNECTMNCGVLVELSAISAGLAKDIARIDELWQQGLDRFGGPFLAGSTFTAVDAFYAPVAFRVQTYQLSLSEASQAYVDRLLELDGLVEWREEAIKETWREPSHEQDCLNAGEILEDYRA